MVFKVKRKGKKREENFKVKLTKDQKSRTTFLPVEQSITVPSTSGVKEQKKISNSQMTARVNNVRRFMSKFGGFTDVKARGGFVLKKTDDPKEKGRLVKEKVVVVRAFATKKDFKKHEPEIIKQVGKWGKSWKQDSVSYEHEGDLLIIKPPENSNSKPKVMKVSKP